MRFSIRSLLLAFVLVALSLTTVVSTWKLRQAREESQRVRKIFGVGGPNRFESSLIADPAINPHRRAGLQLIRLDHPSGYDIKITQYDGVTGQLRGQSLPLPESDLQYLVWHTRSGNFRMQSMLNDDMLISVSSHWPTAATNTYHYPISIPATDIRLGPFLIYIYCPASMTEEPNFQWIGLDLERAKAWCEKYQCQAVYLEFQRAGR